VFGDVSDTDDIKNYSRQVRKFGDYKKIIYSKIVMFYFFGV